MKKITFILSIASLIIAITFGTLFLVKNGKSSAAGNAGSAAVTATTGDIVYLDLDQVIMGYDFASDLQATVGAKIQQMREEVQRRGKKFEKD